MDIIQSQQKKVFKLKCKHHEDQKVTLINVADISTTLGRRMICNECLTNGVISGKFVEVKKIINRKPLQKINNWPFFQDQDIQNLYNQSFENKENLSQKVTKIFDLFKQRLNDLVGQLQKKILSFIDINACDKLIEDIITNSQTQKLDDILTSKQTYDEIEQSLKSFLQECTVKFQEKEQDLGRKKNLFISYSKIIQNISQFQEQIFNKIEDQITNHWNQSSNQIISKLNELQFQVTNYSNSQRYGSIQEENNSIQIIADKNTTGWPQIVSNFVLDKKQKYILRVEIKTEGSYCPAIGLIRQSHREIIHLYEDKLCYFSNCGLQKVVKGKYLFELQPNEIEFYISILDNIMQVSDYPNHENINSLQDGNINLQSKDNLQLAFSFSTYSHKITFLIKDFYIVTEQPIW